MNALNIEIFSDLICPWCYIGRRRLEAGLKILGANELPNIIWRPFELNPDMPKAGLDRKVDLTSLTDVHPPLDLEELLSEDWRKTNDERKESRSQALGRAVTDLAEGILAPSRIRNGRNLVIYPGSLMSESKIEVLGQDKLPN